MEVGGTDSTIVVVSREDGSGTRDCFEQAVLKPIGAEITGNAVIRDSNGAMRTEVAGDGDAIGYLSLGYVNSDVKAVSLDGIEPTIKNIQSGDYAISRTLLMITNGAPDEDEHAFLDFVRSDDGQQIVEDENFIPIASAQDGNIDGASSCVGDINMDDVIYLAKYYYGTDLFPDYGTIYADGDINCDGDIDMDDAIYLAKYYYGTDLFPDYGTLYPCE